MEALIKQTTFESQLSAKFKCKIHGVSKMVTMHPAQVYLDSMLLDKYSINSSPTKWELKSD